jgi:hypothetical protein
MDAIEHEIPLEEILTKHPVISKQISPEEIQRAIDPSNHVGRSHELVDRVIRMVEEQLGKRSAAEDSKVRMCPLMNDKGGCIVPQIV